MVVVLFKAGNQVPVIPLFDVVGRAFKVVPLQTAETELNAGVTLGFTVILKVAFVAHCPALGVKV